ncbi:MAG: hypothetical protein AAFN10_19300 [Bacteroidota bacterium]
MDQNSFYQLQALLIRTGSISIPGIGTFYRTHKPALVQEEKGLISPPSEAVSFKKEVDSAVLFSKHLTEAQFLHPEIAEQIEAELSNYLRKQIKLDGSVSLPNLGLLHLESDGKLTFTSFKVDAIRSNDLHYGLKPIKLPKKPKRSGIPEITMSPMNNGTTTYKSARKPSPINWQPYLLVGVLVLIGVLVIYNGPFLKSTTADDNVVISEEHTTPFQESYPDAKAMDNQAIASAEKSVSGQQSAPVASSTTAPKESSTSPQIDQTPATNLDQVARGTKEVSEEIVIQDMSVADGSLSSLKRSPEIPATTLDPNSTIYHLISASFTQLSKAEEFAAAMKNEGFKTQIILPGDGPSQIHRVSIFQSNELPQVKDVQRQLENAGKKLLWIYNAGPVR